ncbi:hypothetical protein [Dickeya solani]|uniref:hypothetical protein n=1 Tax=Dickeya solani TaxID=1089444 RepID=UPI001396696A|nr:hypothetical protein [Dickeya solani]MBJ2330623.1 hypothetical protein [Dickeya solani]MBJ2339921.1 hypothetical protein [Dickeya solani]MBJ2344314.1 hypothetical protein [Dickeya solani]MBJ2353060.1 hypothetical protein [Dickeya solani]MCZ0787130.1 hypothetical protein [Dickeya solani]
MPPLLDHWLEAKLRRYAVPSLFGPPITRSQRGMGLHGIHAVHPAKSPTSA